MMTFKQMREACWSGFKQVGMKKKGKKLVPNCVPEEEQKEDAPANSAGGGGVAGIGVGPDGEPGVHVKKKKKDDMKTHIMSFLKNLVKPSCQTVERKMQISCFLRLNRLLLA